MLLEIDTKFDSRGPSPCKPRSVSEYRNLLVADRHHLLPKLEDFNEAQKIHLKYPKNIRKFVRARTERRLVAESNDYVNIGYFYLSDLLKNIYLLVTN